MHDVTESTIFPVGGSRNFKSNLFAKSNKWSDKFSDFLAAIIFQKVIKFNLPLIKVNEINSKYCCISVYKLSIVHW